MDADERRAVAAALRERAESILSTVDDRFGPAPRREPLDYPAPDHAPDTFPSSVEEQLDRLAGIAGAWIADDDGRILCVDVTYVDVPWQTPGGAVEPGDSLPETAGKEVREETGLEVALTGLAYTRIAELEYDPEVPETPTVPVAVFTGEPVGGQLESGGNTLPDGRDEIADVDWFGPRELPAGTLDRKWLVEYWGEEGSSPPGQNG